MEDSGNELNCPFVPMKKNTLFVIQLIQCFRQWCVGVRASEFIRNDYQLFYVHNILLLTGQPVWRGRGVEEEEKEMKPTTDPPHRPQQQQQNNNNSGSMGILHKWRERQRHMGNGWRRGE